MNEEKNKKQKLLDAIQASEKKQIVEICRLAGASRCVFYHHLNNDSEFRKAFLQAKNSVLQKQIAAVAG